MDDVREPLTVDEEELRNYLYEVPTIAYGYAKIRFKFDLDEVAQSLMRKRPSMQIAPYPEHGKPYGLRLVGGKWAK